MPEHEAEHHAEHGGAFRARLDLRRAARGTKERGVCRLQRLHRAERLLVLDQSRDERGEPLNPVCSSSSIRPRSSLRAAMIDAVSSSRRCADELLCVDRRKLCGRLGVAVGDVEVQDVRIGRRSDACAAEERAGGQPWNPGGLDDPVRDVGRHRDLRLRLGDPLRILVDGREILDPGEAARQVLVLEEDLRGGGVQRLLPGCLVVRRARDCHRREQDDPPPSPEDADGAKSSWVAVSTEPVHYQPLPTRPYPGP